MVRYDGEPYSVDSSKNTIVWKQIDKNHFERTIFEDGKLLTTRRIQISDDGKTLTEDTERAGAPKTLSAQSARHPEGAELPTGAQRTQPSVNTATDRSR